jgi:hypothetical protein
MKKHLPIWILLTCLASLILACGMMDVLLPGGDSADATPFSIPSISPSEAPNPEPSVNPPSGGQTVKIDSIGQMTSISSDGQYSCPAAATVVLIVKPDGSAEMQVTGPDFIDHINCTQAEGGDLAYFIQGSADTASETVTFTACNNGGFNAQGTVKYSGGALSGEAACLLKGTGQVDMRVSLP